MANGYLMRVSSSGPCSSHLMFARRTTFFCLRRSHMHKWRLSLLFWTDYVLVQGNRTLLRRFVDFKVRHTFREANMVADFLAKAYRDDFFTYHNVVYFDSPPPETRDIVYADVTGVVTPRLTNRNREPPATRY
ncbi:hypothetical protein CRG98_004775 [Punica granatum]|uniref:RNase H type-1 domain-containing protein n=1 Tax=Punica granatum TaxID=22663 RepID=A0A2I0L2Z9_PUNGR|nr:hypothetical protein CRG98_004775 [Punica granatum]